MPQFDIYSPDRSVAFCVFGRGLDAISFELIGFEGDAYNLVNRDFNVIGMLAISGLSVTVIQGKNRLVEVFENEGDEREFMARSIIAHLRSMDDGLDP